MNLITGIKLYIEKMCTDSGPGMKIILLDKETVRIYLQFPHERDMLYNNCNLNYRLV